MLTPSVQLSRYSNDRNLQHAASLSILLLADLTVNGNAKRLGAKTIKKNTNSTQNNSQTHRAKQYEVTSFLSTDCELSTETCSKNVYSLGPMTVDMAGRLGLGSASEKHVFLLTKIRLVLQFLSAQTKNYTTLKR